MDKTWQYLVAFAFVILAIYAGFEIYNSISGGNVEFNKKVTPIDNNLGVDVLDHIQITQERLTYKGEGTNSGNIDSNTDTNTNTDQN